MKTKITAYVCWLILISTLYAEIPFTLHTYLAAFPQEIPFFHLSSKEKHDKVDPLFMLLPTAKNKLREKRLAFFVNWEDGSLESLQQNIWKIDTLIPEWIFLDGPNGKLYFDDMQMQDIVNATIEKVRTDLAIVPSIKNYDLKTRTWDIDTLAQMLASPEARGSTVQNALEYVLKYGYQGINVDFERVPPTSYPNLILFMQELFDVFNPHSLEVSIDIPITELADFPYDKMLNAVDRFFFMAYDEHYIGGHAGPIASMEWFHRSLKNLLKHIPPEKCVLAVGNYSYDWNLASNKAFYQGFEKAIDKARKSNSEIKFDPKTMNPHFTYDDDNNEKHEVWFLDAITAYNQILLGRRHGITEFALWELGSEDYGFWSIAATATISLQQQLDLLKPVYRGFQEEPHNTGGIFASKGDEVIGQRSLSYCRKKHVICQESYQFFSLD